MGVSTVHLCLVALATFLATGIQAQGYNTDVEYINKQDPMINPRVDPFVDTSSRQIAQPYILTPDRLRQIRSDLLYPFYDLGSHENIGDYQKNLRDNSPQISKHLNFLLPFFGMGFNYTWVSMHGYLAFSDGPTLSPTYPLEFPIVEYPKQADPSFIGPFYSKCKIGELAGDELDNRKSGVYFRVERDLMSRTDQLGVELRERSKWDVREGIVGAEWFEPRHVMIVTWKNVSFAGGTIHARKTTNTFQTVIITDETRTYTMFNYKHIGWTTHTEAGGSSEDGTGGTPAFIGFNAGNGTRAFEYKPYSQSPKFQNILASGNVNRFPGRHIFRVDEKIMPGQCIPELYDMTAHRQQLTFAPESGNMLGGTIVNVTGPCFDKTKKITCRFNTMKVPGAVIDENRATCIMPPLYATGYIDLFVEVDGSNDLHWKGKFLVETPFTAPELVSFPDSDHLLENPQKMLIRWDYKNLTLDINAPVSITLWGYRENTINPELIYIDTLAESIANNGEYVINPQDFHRKKTAFAINLEIGLVTVNFSNPSAAMGILYAPVLWSRPIPLAWYLRPQWQDKYGREWSAKMCENWIVRDRLLKNFAADLPICPCNLELAIADKGRFLPDQNCDKDGKVSNCHLHQNAKHCVRSAMPTRSGAGQQCCYDIHGYLMMTFDQKWGGRPGRSHDYGHIPWNEASKVPSLSHYLHDIAPFFPCCMWKPDQSWWCMTFRFERRVSQNCVGYQRPGIATIFGDPHIYTFDGLAYTFNGKGEYVLVKSRTDRQRLDVQARFEQLTNDEYGNEVRGTILTAIAAKDNQSATVEIRLRPRDAQWRYKLDIIVDQHRVFFDRYPQKIQYFPGVIVYTPTSIQNQSHVIAMFESGAGVEVIENKGHLTARVYLPMTFLNQTRGLFGNWSGLIEDDFVLPDGSLGPTGNTNNLETMHNYFGQYWAIDEKETEEKGYSLFYHENGKTSSNYNDKLFRPNFYLDPRAIIPLNVTLKPEVVEDFCGTSYQCKFDYSMTLNKEYGHWTKYYQSQFVEMKDKDLKPVISCGALMTPIHGRKSTFYYTPGTTVDFDCDPDFVLVGERRRTCQANGEWSVPTKGSQDGRTETEWANWNPAKTTRCIETGEHESVNSAKTAGIVLGIIVPLLLLALVIFTCYRNRKHAHDISAEDYSGRRDIELSKKVIEPRIEEGQALKGSPVLNKETSA
ncbi:protein mesh isoform X2 [Folsomia candida]|uniref:protein mesh isoform X2 n=1 Tax=Folsomia candida TaxID=158441 RepID=UPI000B8F0122|nr:protein mesh isoform X2 [Folsomia candida]